MIINKAKIHVVSSKRRPRIKSQNDDLYEIVNGVRVRKDRTSNFLTLNVKNVVTDVTGESDHLINDVIGE